MLARDNKPTQTLETSYLTFAPETNPAEVGRAMAWAVSRRVPTAAARVRAQVGSCWICGGQSDTRAGFLPVLRFPLPIIIPQTVSHS
jgi:hypothetical protein